MFSWSPFVSIQPIVCTPGLCLVSFFVCFFCFFVVFFWGGGSSCYFYRFSLTLSLNHKKKSSNGGCSRVKFAVLMEPAPPPPKKTSISKRLEPFLFFLAITDQSGRIGRGTAHCQLISWAFSRNGRFQFKKKWNPVKKKRTNGSIVQPDQNPPIRHSPFIGLSRAIEKNWLKKKRID